MMQLLYIQWAGLSASTLVLLLFFSVPLLGLSMYIIYKFLRSGREKVEWIHARQLMIEDLKSHGNKLQVPLNACEVVTSEEYQAAEYGSAEIFHGQTVAPEYDSYYIPVVNYTTYLKYHWTDPTSGQQRCFVSAPIAKDKDCVLFYTTSGRQTDIYFDKKDPARYYFDLDFFRESL